MLPANLARPNRVVGILQICIAVQGCSELQFHIDTSQDRHDISPLIYGTNSCRANQLATFCRMGGNRWTAYNWELNVSNAGADNHYANDHYLSSSSAYGGAVTERINTAKSLGADALITIPILGLVAADNAGQLVPPAPTTAVLMMAFQHHFLPSNSTAVGSYPPNTGDGEVNQHGFLEWIKATFSGEVSGASATHLHFAMGNEPELWFNRFQYLHPQKTGFDEVVSLSKAYGALVRSVFPTDAFPDVKIFGPVTSNWDGITDLYNEGLQDFLPYYLYEMKPVGTNPRLLDVLDVHWYPEKTVDGIDVKSDDGAIPKPNVELERAQLPRSLWDGSYDEGTWVTAGLDPDPAYPGVKSLKLLRRLKGMMELNPGVQLAITEYYYGGGANASGGVAQADVLGVFGREGVYAAALWELNPVNTTIYGAFNMYLNYDGAGARFGPTSVRATSSSRRDVMIYASDGAPNGRIVAVAINRTKSSLTVKTFINHSQVLHHAKIYRLATDGSIQLVATQDIGNPFGITLPPMSVSTIALDP